MNSEDAAEQAVPRWLRDAGGTPATGTPSSQEAAVLREVLVAIRRVRHGNVQLSIQDGRVVQIDVTEKKRL